MNDYSSAPQELVATTRFVTPGGQIFRLNTDTVVPGATVDGSGNVTASSSIKAAVTADQIGTAYNVGPTPHLTIPGFQASAPKYAGFYGILPDGAAGGSSTGGPAPTSQDIATAESQMSATLENDFPDYVPREHPERLRVPFTQATMFLHEHLRGGAAP